jgi:hypothetical protein
MTVPRRDVIYKRTYSDGEGGTLTEEQWRALTQAERDRITKLVNALIRQITKGGAP